MISRPGPASIIIKERLGLLRGRVVSADSRSGGRGFDSRPCRVAVALGKQFTLTSPSPPTCKMGTQLQAILEFVICACNTLQMGLKWHWFAGALVALLLWRHSSLSNEAKFPERD
ncbi:hypothetical protein ElyMa_007052100 [Elysia marginata]|uniref:Uncharacterized protein n=1 Tax=Elysia marginata TaxID=1093978 RepID=A0AAV4JUL3_9GAST|nr:hypothetical protein ElyMa_007052100 [Elysia marginata]